MKPAAIGVRVHSGWSVLVAVSGDAGTPEIVDRKRIVIMDSSRVGTKQPYHFAGQLTIEAAEKHLTDCAAASELMAQASIAAWRDELRSRHYGVADCAMLLASGRTLPVLPDILSSHALIHTAEGEFFRKAMRDAFEHLCISVTGLRERELDERAARAFGAAAQHTLQRISGMGQTLGPPWTKDEKSAALAALILLTDGSKKQILRRAAPQNDNLR